MKGNSMANIIAIIVLVILVGSAILYMVRSKKKGVQCIGCPYAGTCSSGSCGGSKEEDR